MEQTSHSTPTAQTFRKAERLCRQKLIDRLFSSGSRSLTAFPLRLVYRTVEIAESEEPVSLLISVPKKKLRRAVKRNRSKRQVREAYRRHRTVLLEAVDKLEGQHLIMAFVWLADELCDSSLVEKSVNGLLIRTAERLTRSLSTTNPEES